MVLKYAHDRPYGRLGRLGLLCLMLLAGTVLTFAVSRPAAADTSPCSGQVMRSASVESTLQVQTKGVNSPSITSITKVTIPKAWHGTLGLFGNARKQRSSLRCFMPIDQGDFQSAPPNISIDPATLSDPARVHIINTITVVDGSESSSSWGEGLWSIVRRTWGYQVTFQPKHIPAAAAHSHWTVTLYVPGLNILRPTHAPNTDDGRGKLIWWFSPSRQHIPSIAVSLTSPWQVRMNLAADTWPMRWVSDATYALIDGVLIDLVALWVGFRLWRSRRKGSKERQLPKSLIFISLFSIACYVAYVIDDYFWQTIYNNGIVLVFETPVLVAIAIAFYMKALEIRLDWILWAALLSVAATITIGSRQDQLFTYYHTGNPTIAAAASLLIQVLPLLSVIAFMGAGAVVWAIRLWPSGAKARQGYLRELDDTPFKGHRAGLLLLGAFIFSVLIVAQSAGASYYYWLHSDLWAQSPGAFAWVADALLADMHWWLDYGIHWLLSFTVIIGIFAALWALSADGRGVFVGQHEAGATDKSERRDLTLLTVVVASLFIGTHGYYEGVGIPLQFIVMCVGLGGFGLTRILSKLDRKLMAEHPDVGNSSTPGGSFLLAHRDDFLSGPPDPQLPKTVDPGVTALALGPADTWWDNGVVALKTAGYLAIIPVAFDSYVSWVTGHFSQLNYPFGLLDALGYIITEVVSWLIGVFMFGVLVPYLRGTRTPIKGLVFGVISCAALWANAAVVHGLGMASDSYFPIEGLLAVALFTAEGVLLDMYTLRDHHANEGLIKKLYPLGSVRVAVTTLTTLIVIGVTVWQTIYLTDQTAEQRAQNVSDTAQYVNTFGGVTPGGSGGPGG